MGATPTAYRASVLIVEDNVANQMVISAFLKKFFCRSVCVGNGLEALEILNDRSFDLIFLDIQMPEMDGFETIKQIRRNKLTADHTVVAMTAHVLAGEREKCLEAGMDDYLPKPIRMQSVEGVLSKWLKTEALPSDEVS